MSLVEGGVLGGCLGADLVVSEDEKMDVEKCVAEVRRGVERYREYEYCKEFLDAMYDHADKYVPRLADEFSSVGKLVEWVTEYVYCVCTGLELSEGQTWQILGPLPYYTPDDIYAVLTRDYRRSREAAKLPLFA